MDVEVEYRRLLERFSAHRPGWGAERKQALRTAQPMTYALVALAEARAPWTEDGDRGRRSIGWLLRHADLDGDGRVGWGLPQAWDAFGDGVGAAGSVNPPNHPYTITTAFVLQALTAATQAGWLDDRQRQSAIELATAAAGRWTKTAMSPTNEGEFFWYSPHLADAKFCPNVSSMMAGAIASGGRAGIVVTTASMRVRVDAAVRGVIAATVGDAPLSPAWHYVEDGRPTRLNDAVHHAYTLWGVEEYRASDGAVPIPWSPADATASLKGFRRGRRLVEVAIDTPTTAPAMRLWGAGMVLALWARYGSLKGATGLAKTILGAYVGPNGPTYLPGADPTSFYSRHAAHLLLGLAELGRRLGPLGGRSGSAPR